MEYIVGAGLALAVGALATATRLDRDKAFYASVLVVAAFGAAAFAQTPDAVRTAQVDGHTVAYRVMGSSGPAVVMISGLGDGMASFAGVAPELAKNARVIIYDRAGYGRSTLGPGPRDAAAADRELAGLLVQAGVPGPYVLVGHSLGGLYAEHYAAGHPDQIAGLILEESRPADFTRKCEAAEITMCAPTVEMMRTSPKGAQAETAALAATAKQVEAARPLHGRPVLVLSHPIPKDPQPFDDLWARGQADLTARYSGAAHRIAPSGGHYVHRSQKAWFLAAVLDFLPPPH